MERRKVPQQLNENGVPPGEAQGVPARMVERRLLSSARDSATSLEDAFMRRLVASHQEPLIAFVARLVGGDRQRAEDIVQETMLRAWRHKGTQDPSPSNVRSLRPWLITVARRIAIDEHRARTARLVETYDRDLTIVPTPDTTETRTEVNDRDRIRDALKQLTPSHRAILFQRYYLDRTAEEAAASLGIPLGTAKSRTYYGLRALKEILKERGVTDSF